MRQPAYPLATVQRFREHKQQKAQERFAEALGALAREEGTLAACEAALRTARAQELAAARQTFELAADTHEIKILDTQRHRDALDFARARVARSLSQKEAQERQVEQARAAVEAARLELAKTSQDVEAIEKHHGRWRVGVAVGHQRLEESRRSDFALNLWVQRMQGEAR